MALSIVNTKTLQGDTMEQQVFLTFVVMNPRLFKTGGAASYQFKQSGGFIGHDDSCQWVLPDPNNALVSPYCQIKFQDGRYIMLDLNGGISVNDKSASYEQNKEIIIHSGDVFRLGSYQVKAHIKVVEVELEHSYRGIEQLQIADDNGAANADKSMISTASLAQNESPGSNTGYLPQLEIQSTEIEAQAQTTSSSGIRLAADNETEIKVSPEPLVVPSCDVKADDSKLDEAKFDEAQVRDDVVVEQPELTKSSDKDEQFMSLTGNDPQQSLLSSIKGLVAIHQRQDQGFHLLNRSFQPIQDNPLKMGLSYQETHAVMFGEERNMFHLEPAQAIESSLQSIESHHERVHQATQQALQYLLDELSPTTLLKRFQSYRKSAPDGVDEDAWAWKMYQSYFAELTSGRQKGFEKQFWQVLEQSYDELQRQQDK